MRAAVLSVLVAFVLAGSSAPPVLSAAEAPLSAVAAGALALQPPDATLDVDVDTDGDRAWYASPMWITIGVIAVIVVLLLVMLAARGGGGTTIIKE